MKTKGYYLVLILSIAFLTACRKDSEDSIVSKPTDKLTETGVLGIWEISGRTINGITLLTPQRGEFLEFKADENLNDLKGSMTFLADNRVKTGSFVIDPDGDTIQFNFEDRKHRSKLEIQGLVMRLQYKDGLDDFDENWRRKK